MRFVGLSKGRFWMLGLRLDRANQIAKKAFWVYHKMRTSHYENLIRIGLPPVGIYRKTRVHCSDPCCCGNPRRAKGKYEPSLTVQERKAPRVSDEW